MIMLRERFESHDGPPAKSNGAENVEFFQALNAYIASVKDPPKFSPEAHNLVEAWIRGWAAGRGRRQP